MVSATMGRFWLGCSGCEAVGNRHKWSQEEAQRKSRGTMRTPWEGVTKLGQKWYKKRHIFCLEIPGWSSNEPREYGNIGARVFGHRHSKKTVRLWQGYSKGMLSFAKVTLRFWEFLYTIYAWEEKAKSGPKVCRKIVDKMRQNANIKKEHYFGQKWFFV